jgi:general secretion pathway protein L
VIFELPADKIVTRRASVPSQSREFLAGLVHNQIELLSPWPADQAVYGFDAELSGENTANLDIRVLITPRTVVIDALNKLAAIGLRVDRIVARGSDDEIGKASILVTVWSRRIVDAAGESLDGARRLIGISIAAVLGAVVALTACSLVSASSIRGENNELASRFKLLEQQWQALPAAERAWAAKETSASGVILLEVLSRALPDAAYLTELRLEGEMLHIVGLANDAPALLAPLERSGHLANVRFFAPTTREPDAKLFRFHIEARVAPRIEIAEQRSELR